MTNPAPPNLSDNAPWKQRYQTNGTVWTALAKECPERGLICSNETGIYQLYAWDVSTGTLKQLTNIASGKASGSISPDGRYVYYLDDKGGNEIGHYVRISFEGGEPEDITPDMPPYSTWGVHTGRSGKAIWFVTADGEGYHLYTLAVGADGTLGAPEAIYHAAKLTLGATVSPNDEIAVLTTTERSRTLEFGLHAIDASTGETISELWDSEGNSVQAAMFSPVPGDLRILCDTDRAGPRRPFLWNPLTNEQTPLDCANLEGDVLPLDWSHDGNNILLCQVHQAVQKLYIYDLASHQLSPIAHPEGRYAFYAGGVTYFGSGDEIFTQWQDSANPSRTIAINIHDGKLKTLFVPASVPKGHPWKSITFDSSDGQQIQGWLGLPDGEGPFPTILHTHGGPEAVTAQQFSPDSQAWMDHGYAFLTINYRGSTTFGKKFQEQIWGNPGHWEIEDMRAARDWLVDNNIADPNRILVTGASYGGYLTLLALGKLPELWAGGMGVVAIADWSLLYEDEAEMIRGYQRALFGGTPEELPEQHAESSPITYVEAVRAPLLVIQGRNDTRCPERQMEVYEAKMRSLGKSIEVQWFNAGHGSLDVEQQISQQAEMLKFAYKVLNNA